MAIDNHRKRASVLSHGRPWKRPGIVPDGSFSQGDRQHITSTYAGVLVGSTGVTFQSAWAAQSTIVIQPGMQA